MINKLNKILLILTTFCLLYSLPVLGQITFSEVMFNPATNEYYDEFIEIYNAGNSPVLLKSTVLDRQARLDINGSTKSLYSPDNDYLLEAGERAVILDNGYLVENKSDTYDEIIPDTVLLLTIEEASFGLKNGVANQLYLLDPVAGDTMSAYRTTPDQEEGHSDEKILVDEENIPANWGNSLKQKGTPGLPNSIAPRDFDAGFVSSELIRPARPIFGDELFINFKIENKGRKTISGAGFLCGLDENQDSILQNGEISYQTSISIDPGEFYTRELSFVNQNIHKSIIIAKISYQKDEDLSNNREIKKIYIGYPDTSLIVNEIMYDPDQGSDWIELYNKSSFTINLKNWKIFDAVGYESIPGRDWFLSPKAHIAIVEDSSFLDLWGDDAQILAMNRRLPSFNNSGDEVVLRDHTNRIIDSLRYDDSWGGGDGRSLERRNPNDSSNIQSNWASSEAYQGATPGRQNSIMVQEQDARIVRDSVKVSPDNILKGDSVYTSFILENVGLKPIEYLEIEARYHQIPDSLANRQPIKSKKYEINLASGATFQDTLIWELPSGGCGYLQLTLIAPTDRNKQNNQIIIPIAAGYPAKSLLINEIMYNPESGTPEWFEIKNVSDNKINLCDWFFKDSQNNLNYITRNIAFLQPGDMLVVTEDMSFLDHYPDFLKKLILAPTFPTLNNNSDSLALIDPAGNYVDSLFYTAEWGSDKGRSIERQSPEKWSGAADNWALSQDQNGATPGQMNSVAMQRYDLSIDSVFFDDPQILEQDSATIKVAIRNSGIEQTDEYKVLINLFDTDSLSELFYQDEIENTKPIQSESVDTIGFQVAGFPGGVHYYNVNVMSDRDQAIENNGLSGHIEVGYQESAVVINEIMYDPATGEAEWIELFNTTNKPVNLQKWQFKDATDNRHNIVDSVFKLNAQDFAILASNSEFYQSYPEYDRNIIIPESFPSLNNTSESLFIFDAVNHQVDIINYQNEWGGGNAISLERRNPYISAVDSSNWGSSQDTRGATPGKSNSILKFDYDLAVIDSDSIFSAKNVESGVVVPFKIEVANKGINTSAKYIINLYRDSNQDGLAAEAERVWELRNIPALEPDHKRIIEGQIFSGEPGRSEFIIEIKTEKDHNPHNNRILSHLNISYAKRALVINEFMANPDDEQVEFVELYNPTEDTIDISNWNLRNSWNAWHIASKVLLDPGGYIVMAGDSAYYDYFGRENVLISEKFPRLTNLSDTISLLDLSGKTIDSLFYDEGWNITRGKSLEKYLPEYNSAEQSSWKLSIAEKGATPGEFNSISPLEYDLAIDSLIYTTRGDTDDVFPITFIFSNQGRSKTKNANLIIRDSAKNIVKKSKIPNINTGESKQQKVEIGPLDRGYNHLTAEIQWQQDLNKSNNRTNFKIYVSYLPGELVISEFMAIPFSTHREGYSIAEYVEIYNFKNKPVELTGWSITDANTAEKHKFGPHNTIRAKDFFTIADDSSIVEYPTINNSNYYVPENFPNLNNKEDRILLVDPTGVVIDSLSYFSTWNLEQGIAQEKVFLENPNLSNNWRSSTAEKGGTPGYENSVKVTNLAKKPGFRAKPEAFTPDGDGNDDKIGFYYRVSFSSAYVTLTIYDLTGRIIAQPAYRTHSSSEGVIYWNGDSKYGGKARVGRYIARINAVDAETKDKEGYITTFVIAKRNQ